MAWLMLMVVLAPCLLTGFSKRVEGDRKRKWVLINLVFSWFGYIAFLIFTRKDRA